MLPETRSVPELGEILSNAGRWGKDDEKGTLNLITPEHTARAAALVRSGRVVAVGHVISMEPTAHKPLAGYHRMLYRQSRDTAADAVMIECHGYELTHIDALAHNALDGRTYNDRTFSDVITRDGLLFGSVMALADGIATRGVLLDIARSQDRSWLERGEEVTAEDLERAEDWAGVKVGSGDALLVRIGLEAREAVTGPQPPDVRAGLGKSCIEWLYDHEVSVFGGDCIDQMPSGDAYSHPLHAVGIARMGLVLVDHMAVEDLSATCVAEGRWEFFYSVAALRIAKATGSPVNPLCIF
jgi:kynurenine formamidase